jgi:hypothetical protein
MKPHAMRRFALCAHTAATQAALDATVGPLTSRAARDRERGLHAFPAPADARLARVRQRPTSIAPRIAAGMADPGAARRAAAAVRAARALRGDVC